MDIVLTLEGQKRIDIAQSRAREDLERLIFGYAQEYPKTVALGHGPGGRDTYGRGPQNRKRLFGLYASYAVTLCRILLNEGLSPNPSEIVAEVFHACKGLRPAFEELTQDEEFRACIVGASSQHLDVTQAALGHITSPANAHNEKSEISQSEGTTLSLPSRARIEKETTEAFESLKVALVNLGRRFSDNDPIATQRVIGLFADYTRAVYNAQAEEFAKLAVGPEIFRNDLGPGSTMTEVKNAFRNLAQQMPNVLSGLSLEYFSFESASLPTSDQEGIDWVHELHPSPFLHAVHKALDDRIQYWRSEIGKSRDSSPTSDIVTKSPFGNELFPGGIPRRPISALVDDGRIDLASDRPRVDAVLAPGVQDTRGHRGSIAYSGLGKPTDERATRRKAVILPILRAKRWTRGKWATISGVGKNSVYEYLDGRRDPSSENRTAMAEALGLKPDELPE